MRANILSIKYDNFSKDFLEWEYNSVVKSIFSKVNFYPIHKITDNQINDLLKLTMDKNIMHGIGIS